MKDKKKSIVTKIILGFVSVLIVAGLVFWLMPRTLELPEKVDRIVIDDGGYVLELNASDSQELLAYLKEVEIGSGKASTQPYGGGFTLQFYCKEESVGKIYVVNLNEIYVTDSYPSIKYYAEMKDGMYLYDYLRQFVDAVACDI